MERDTIAREMAALGFASMGDYIEIDADGSPRFKLGELTPAQLRAIQEIIIEEPATGGRKVRLKLHDKRAALVDLAKLLGFHREVYLYGQASGQGDAPAVPWIVQPVAPAPGAGPR